MRPFSAAALAITFLLFAASGAEAGLYLDYSAHGNSNYGVDNTATPEYTVGHCGHCHEQHATLGAADDGGDAGAADPRLLLATVYGGRIAGDSLETAKGNAGSAPAGADPCAACHGAQVPQKIYVPGPEAIFGSPDDGRVLVAPGGPPGGDSGTAYPYLLFGTGHVSQTENFCFGCHSATGSLQSGGGVVNRSYSYNFGGHTEVGSYDNDIKEQFSHVSGSGSSHWLADIAALRGVALKDANNASFTIPADMNPCRICHDPHLVQRNNPVSFLGLNLYTAVTRKLGGLWGDNTTERMNSRAPTVNYYAPFWRGSTTTFEPAGDATSNGSNLPSYIYICTDCHNHNNTITTHNPRFPDGSRALRKFRWIQTGDLANRHGGRTADACNTAPLLPPYPGGSGSLSAYKMILNCTDCHEPHGSKTNVFLLRSSVNGKTVVAPTTDKDAFTSLCTSCHQNGPPATHHISLMYNNVGYCYTDECHSHTSANLF
jgi:cytochrome c553